jgi:hypothetical protein
MAAKYYVAIRPQTNERHIVHKEGCPLLPEDGKRIYLGLFRSCHQAESEGQKHFSMTGSCPFCLKEYHNEMNEAVPSPTDFSEDIPTSIHISLFQKGSTLYFLN